MSVRDELVAAPAAAGSSLFSISLTDVTGTHEVVADDVQPSLPAAAVARAAASRMSLPENVPWSLHDDQGAFLDDDQPIGDQVQPGANLWVSPKTHLG